MKHVYCSSGRADFQDGFFLALRADAFTTEGLLRNKGVRALKTATIFGTSDAVLQHGARELTAAKYGHATGL